MNFRLSSIVAVTIALSGCGIFQKTNNSTATTPVVNLDTVETVAAAEPPVYQPSATRINDLLHTKLDVSFDWTKQYLYGKATLTLKPYFYNTSVLDLDARGMTINEVDLVSITTTSVADKKGKTTSQTTTNKTPLHYTYANDVLHIELGKDYTRDEQYTVFIDYISKPNELTKKGGSAAITDDKGLYFINPDGKEKNKPKQIWTQGETQSNSVWCPTIDRPNERMTQEIYMTVDTGYVTLSNGELASSFNNGDGTRTDYWRMDLPIAPYLTMMAVGDFAIVKDNKWHGKEVNYYLEKEYRPYAKAIFGNTPEMLEFYSNLLGVEYPWNKYSQIIVRDYVSGAMENVTATLHGDFLQKTPREMLDDDHEDVIAHELFHQWFGDYVTCESWSNIPLNESFATYGEYLWIEHKYGKEAADQHSAESRAGYINESAQKELPLIRFNYDDREDMFDAHSYNKGGQVLNMLRELVGDDAFFASLKLYLQTNKFNSVEVHNLRLAFEAVTGQDLNWFFNQWFLSPGHPELVIKTSYDAAAKKAKLNIRQVQDLKKLPLFRLPMYVDIYTAPGKKQREKIEMTTADQDFEFDVDAAPLLMNVDADKTLLCVKTETKPMNEWVFQYNNAPLFLDRYEALQAFQKQPGDSLAQQGIIAALDDHFWYLRYEAEGMLKDVYAGNEAAIKTKLTKLATTDPKAVVRSSAIGFLTDNYTDEALQAVYQRGLKDSSYSVIGASLAGIAKQHPEEAMKVAQGYEREKSQDILYAICDLYAGNAGDDKNDFFLNVADKFTGFSTIGYITSYAAYLKKGKKDTTVENGVKKLAELASAEGASRWIVYYAKRSIKDIYTIYANRVDFGNQKLNTEKASNPKGDTNELEAQIASDSEMQKKIADIFNAIK